MATLCKWHYGINCGVISESEGHFVQWQSEITRLGPPIFVAWRGRHDLVTELGVHSPSGRHEVGDDLLLHLAFGRTQAEWVVQRRRRR